MESAARRAVVGFVAIVAVAAGVVIWNLPDPADPAVRSTGAGGTSVVPAFEAATTTRGPARTIDNRLFLLGDSVLQGAAPRIADLLGDWSVASDTRVGRFLDEGIRVAKRRRRQIGEVVIVGLGNNYGGDEDGFAAQVDDLLATLDGADHILWLTVAEFRPDRREVNAALRAAARRDRRVVLVDWVPWWRRHPAYTSSDRLHLTPEGAQAMAELVADALADRLAGLNARPAANPRPPDLEEKGSIPIPRSRSTTTSDRENDPQPDSGPEVPTSTAPPSIEVPPSTTVSTTEPAPSSSSPSSSAPTTAALPSDAAPSAV